MKNTVLRSLLSACVLLAGVSGLLFSGRAHHDAAQSGAASTHADATASMTAEPDKK